MKFRYFPLIALFAFTGIHACKQKPSAVETQSEGIPGEIMVVGSEEELSQLENTFQTHFQLKDSNLLIAEKAEARKFENLYDFYFVRDKAYKGTEKNASTILVWNNAGDFSSDLDDAEAVKVINEGDFTIKCYKNIWAQPQTVLWVKFKGESLGAEASALLAKTAMAYIRNTDALPGNLLPNAYCDSVMHKIKGTYGFEFALTPQFRLEFTNYEVVWFRQETSRFYRDIFINIFSDSNAIDSREKAIENRNLFSLKYLKNEENTRVMVSQSALFPLQYSMEGNVGVLRGWYQEEGTFRRGPFIRYFYHDAAHKRYVAFDGFVHAPDMPRQQFYRTFEIMARSFAFDK